MNIRIDFVGDPVICEDEGEEGAQGPEAPAKSIAACAGGRGLQGDVHEIGGGVAGIGDQGEDGHEEKGSQSQCGTEMGPGGHDPGNGDENEDEIVDKAAWLPKAGGVGELSAKLARG